MKEEIISESGWQKGGKIALIIAGFVDVIIPIVYQYSNADLSSSVFYPTIFPFIYAMTVAGPNASNHLGQAPYSVIILSVLFTFIIYFSIGAAVGFILEKIQAKSA